MPGHSTLTEDEEKKLARAICPDCRDQCLEKATKHFEAELTKYRNGCEFGNELYVEMKESIATAEAKAKMFMEKWDKQNVEIEQLESELAAKETEIAKHVVNNLTSVDRIHGLQDVLIAIKDMCDSYNETGVISDEVNLPLLAERVFGIISELKAELAEATKMDKLYSEVNTERLLLVAELAAFRWIPVSERLPEDENPSEALGHSKTLECYDASLRMPLWIDCYDTKYKVWLVSGKDGPAYWRYAIPPLPGKGGE